MNSSDCNMKLQYETLEIVLCFYTLLASSSGKTSAGKSCTMINEQIRFLLEQEMMEAVAATT